jgi:hypothetical protein
MAVYTGMSIQALYNTGEDGIDDLLTDREKEALLWAAAGKTSSETSQILGLSDRRYIGDFVLHCHILDHEDQGMMQNIRIALPDGKGGPRATTSFDLAC